MRYEFILAERVGTLVLRAFPDLDESELDLGQKGTVMYGRVVDSPHLHGILDRFQEFGLTVVEMRRLPD